MKRLLLLMMMGVLGLTHSSPARAAVSEGKYMAGGIVGTVVGFGIGHAVVGEYKKIGWVFTVGETAGLGLVIGGVAWAANKKTINGGVWALYGIGAVSMLAFHVWEVVDIWTRPVVKKGRRASLDGFDDEPASPRFALLPAVIPDGGGLALGLRY